MKLCYRAAASGEGLRRVGPPCGRLHPAVARPAYGTHVARLADTAPWPVRYGREVACFGHDASNSEQAAQWPERGGPNIAHRLRADELGKEFVAKASERIVGLAGQDDLALERAAAEGLDQAVVVTEFSDDPRLGGIGAGRCGDGGRARDGVVGHCGARD